MKTHLFGATLALISLTSTAATVTGTLVGGGGADDLQLAIIPTEGAEVSAYCADHCGDWFDQDEATEAFQLKKELIGKKVQMTYKEEQNRDRIVGPDSNERLMFIQRVQFLK